MAIWFTETIPPEMGRCYLRDVHWRDIEAIPIPTTAKESKRDKSCYRFGNDVPIAEIRNTLQP